MKPADLHQQPAVHWAVDVRPAPGESVCGDLHLVEQSRLGCLLAVVDGLGHGDEATAVARVALAVLAQSPQESLAALVLRCHEALAGTRGVVLTLASLKPAEGQLTWLGVGNVEARLVRAEPGGAAAHESLLLHRGVVGYHLPALRPRVVSVQPRDLILLATDGVRPGFAEGLNSRQPLDQITQTLLREQFKGTDDGLVLAARYLGPPRE